jgi:hypothetical protein
MPDAKQRRPETTRDDAARAVCGPAPPADVAGRADAVTDALRVVADGRAAARRRANQAALAAAVRDLRSHGRMDHVR